VPLDTQLTFSAPVKQTVRKGTQSFFLFDPFLERRNTLSLRNGGPLYKQFTLPLMN
jgi:hypothetical protein